MKTSKAFEQIEITVKSAYDGTAAAGKALDAVSALKVALQGIKNLAEIGIESDNPVKKQVCLQEILKLLE